MKTVVSRMKSNLLHQRWLLLSKSMLLFFFLMAVLPMMAQKLPATACPQQKIDAVRLSRVAAIVLSLRMARWFSLAVTPQASCQPPLPSI